MTYDLVIGDRAYSSWSLRGWLLFDAFGLPVKTLSARLYTDELATLLRDFHPARTAPTMRTPDGCVVPETIAIAGELATRHPEAGLWPKDPRARSVARVLAAEMHAGFTALRSYCPMNLRVSYTDCGPSQAVFDDLARLEVVWSWARSQTGSQVWLCGDYSAADAFFARSPAGSPPTICPSAPTPRPMCKLILPIRLSAVGALWVWSMARIRSFTAATIPAATGRDQNRSRPKPSRGHSPKTPPAPIRASP